MLGFHKPALFVFGFRDHRRNRHALTTPKGMEWAKSQSDFEIKQQNYENLMDYLHDLRGFFVNETRRYLPDVPIPTLKDFSFGWLKGFAPPNWDKFIAELETVEFEANREAAKILNALGTEPSTDAPGASSLPSVEFVILRPHDVVYEPPPAETNLVVPAIGREKVILQGRTLPALVNGKKKKVTSKQYDLIEALLKARPIGMTKDGIENIHGGARGILRGLIRDTDWREVLHMAGASNCRYRID